LLKYIPNEYESEICFEDQLEHSFLEKAFEDYKVSVSIPQSRYPDVKRNKGLDMRYDRIP